MDFDDVAPQGGWLVGVEVHVTKWLTFDVIGGVRPIFQASGKTLNGAQHGKLTDRVVRAVAKPGYAVGAINVKAGAGVDGLSVTFMKVTANGGLDTKDSYESEWIGGLGGGGKTMIGGDGAPVIGLCGRVNDGQHTGALGLVLSAGNK